MRVVVTGTAMNVLDDWLPILHALKNLHPELEAQLFIPFKWILRADPAHDLEALSEEIFLEVIVEKSPGDFRAFDSIRHARNALKKRRKPRLSSVVRSPIFRHRPPITSTPWQADRILLFDWSHSAASGTLGNWYRDNGFMACFALCHGPVPDFRHNAQNHAPNRDNFSGPVWSKTFFFGADCVAWPDISRRDNLGMPRHDPQWLKKIGSVSKELPAKSLTYISRAEDNLAPGYLPVGSRLPLLSWLYAQCRENEAHLVVKRHPHEFTGFGESLPRSEYGNTWSFANQSALSNILRSEYVAMTHSSVALDAIATGRAPVSLRNAAYSLAGLGVPEVETWLEAEFLILTPRTPEAATAAIWNPADNSKWTLLRNHYERLVGQLDGNPATNAARRISDAWRHGAIV